MAKVISIALQKGGTAKTTTAINLAANLSHRKKKVLLIDMDSQANASFASGVNVRNLQNSLYNLLTTDRRYKCNLAEVVLHGDSYDVIPADSDVIDLSKELDSVTVLKSILKPIQESYDYIVIDCPPALSIITQNALAVSDYVIIPSEPKPFNFTGMVDLKEMINDIQNGYNTNLQVLGILLVKYNRRTNLTKTIQQMIEGFAVQLQTTVYSSTIREGVAVPESQLAQKPLIDYAPSANPTIDYKAFTTETLKRMGEI